MKRIPVRRAPPGLLMLLCAACAGAPAATPADLAGRWSRGEDAFPPVDLTLTDEGSTLGARLQLSGRDAQGTARIDGSRLLITLDGGRSEMEGEIAADEIRLRFGHDGLVYPLRRAVPESPAAGRAADDRIEVAVQDRSLRVTNRTTSTIAFSAYDRMRLLTRASIIDPCMESPTRLCASVEPGATRAVPLDEVIGYRMGSTELSVRYWRVAEQAGYPANAKELVVRVR
jgi:hypothetical protein